MAWRRRGSSARVAGAVLLWALVGGGPAQGQRPKDDVVHLQGGLSLRGTIVERIPGTSLSLRTRDGVVWVLAESQIERVEPKSLLGAVPPGSTVRVPDSALVGEWVRIKAKGVGRRQGVVVWVDSGTVVVQESARRRPARIPRAAISSAAVSTEVSRPGAVLCAAAGIGGGLLGAVMGFAGALAVAMGSPAGSTSAPGTERAVLTVATVSGAVLGAVGARSAVRKRGWRPLDVNPSAGAAAVSSTGVAVGVRVRL